MKLFSIWNEIVSQIHSTPNCHFPKIGWKLQKMVGDLMYVQMQQIDCSVRESGRSKGMLKLKAVFFIKGDWPVKHATLVVA